MQYIYILYSSLPLFLPFIIYYYFNIYYFTNCSIDNNEPDSKFETAQQDYSTHLLGSAVL